VAEEQPGVTRSSSAGPGDGASLYLLVVEDGSSRILVLPRDGEVVAGRDPDVEVRVKNEAASRRHAQITLRDGRAEVKDLGSRNGTEVNGEPLSAPRALSTGDAVAVGEATLIFHSERRRASPGAALLGADALRKRLEQEVERGTRYERPLALLSLSVTPVERLAAFRVPAYLRAIDVAGLGDDGHLLVILPELRPDQGEAEAARFLQTLTRNGFSARGGMACCPDDGCDAETLLAVARAAATSAPAGRVATAKSGATRLELGDRVVVLADPAMVRLYQLIRRLAQSALPVLISGETGSGKENAAFAIHHFSARAQGPFVAINCAALPETLAESELFGHEKGAFTGAAAAKAGRLESAEGGTVFLDEVGELPLVVQAKLLRALDERRITRLGAVRDKPIDVRIVAATNRELEKEVRAGGFRQDLFFRLGAATVVLPPLRDRPREIGLLSRTFLAAVCAREGRPEPELSAAALRQLSSYRWPGNVRELKNAMEYVAATTFDDVIEPWHLPERIAPEAPVETTPALPAFVPPSGPATAVGPPSRQTFRPIAEEVRALERRRMEEALSASSGNQTRAAALLSMPLRTFVLKLKQFGIGPRAP